MVVLTADAIIVKIARTEFVIVDREVATRVPLLGDAVTVMPYARRGFNGDRLDRPRREKLETVDGKTYETTTVLLGGAYTALPLPQVTCRYLKDMIEQVERLPANDGSIRKIVHMLVDANATDFQVGDPSDQDDIIATPPEISCAVRTAKFEGRLAILYDRASDYYVVELRRPGEIVRRIGDVDFMSLAATIGDLIDDGTWRLIEIEVANKPSRNRIAA